MTKTFSVWVDGPTWELTEEEIWPDKDGPEDPTAEDVIDAMKSYGRPGDVIRDWALDDGLKINVDYLTYGS